MKPFPPAFVLVRVPADVRTRTTEEYASRPSDGPPSSSTRSQRPSWPTLLRKSRCDWPWIVVENTSRSPSLSKSANTPARPSVTESMPEHPEMSTNFRLPRLRKRGSRS